MEECCDIPCAYIQLSQISKRVQMGRVHISHDKSPEKLMKSEILRKTEAVGDEEDVTVTHPFFFCLSNSESQKRLGSTPAVGGEAGYTYNRSPVCLGAKTTAPQQQLVLPPLHHLP